jgi:DNA helicase-2/ATP-dependent DNA helicase PcrA
MLIAAEEGILPNIRKRAPTDFEEERRLFYVAATRAKNQLDVLYAKKRAGEAHEPSRYITELNEQVLPREADPLLAQLEKKLHRREQKARQGTLF